ncbi:MAG: AEC family transporter [Verrucomicrobiota bacterium]
MQTSLIFAAVMPIFIIIALGFLVRRVGWLNMEADRSLMAVVVNALYPCLILDFILGNEALRQTANVILPPLVGLTSVVVGFGLAMLVARKLQIGNQRECRTFAFTTGIYNYGYLAIPIVALLFDRETTGVLLVHNLGVEIAMWVLGVGFVLSPNDPKTIWKRVFSGPVIAIFIAIPLNFLRAEAFIPQFILEAIHMLGVCAIPLGLILTGATFADLAPGVRIMDRLKLPISGCVLRIGVLPIIFLLSAWILPLPTELKAVICVQAAMPCGVFPIILARHFDGSPEVSLKLVLSTTLISLFTIPIWVLFGLKLLGL